MKNLLREQAARIPPVASYTIDVLLFLFTCAVIWLIHSVEVFNEDDDNKLLCAVFALLTICFCEAMKVFLIAAFSEKSTVLLGRVELDIFY